MSEPKPVIGWLVFGIALLIRAWALPFAIASWIVGTLIGACVVGFAFAWETPEFKWAERLRNGTPRKQPPMLDDDDEDEDDI